jgi:hypothetical protein
LTRHREENPGIYGKFVAADVAALMAKGNRDACVFSPFTTDEYGSDTMSAPNPDN